VYTRECETGISLLYDTLLSLPRFELDDQPFQQWKLGYLGGRDGAREDDPIYLHAYILKAFKFPCKLRARCSEGF